tara:strand:- start:962 stop:1783 length:822 start_codon:yes stop_codon:yes gene_type:complete
MPQFLEPNADELNSYRRVNKKIMSDLKRQYRGTESTLGVEGDIQDKYNFVYEKMVDILGSLSEITNQLKLGHSAPQGSGSKAIDRFIGGTSAVLTATKVLLNYIEQEVPSLSIFPVEQQQTISGMNDQIVSEVLEIDQLSTQFLAPAVLQRFRSVISSIQGDLMVLQQRLEGTQGDMGVGSLGQTFTAPSVRQAEEDAKRVLREATKASQPKAPASARKGRPSNREVVKSVIDGMLDQVEGSGYMGVGRNMKDGHGEGYRTQLVAGMMPTRFL